MNTFMAVSYKKLQILLESLMDLHNRRASKQRLIVYTNSNVCMTQFHYEWITIVEIWQTYEY